MKYSTDVVLTSEEESLAEFVGGLPSSSGDSFERPQKKVRIVSTSLNWLFMADFEISSSR